MKRAGVILLICIFLFSILSIGLASAEQKNNPFETFTSAMSSGWKKVTNYVENQAGWLIGSRDRQGRRIALVDPFDFDWDEFVKYMIIGLIIGAPIGLLFSQGRTGSRTLKYSLLGALTGSAILATIYILATLGGWRFFDPRQGLFWPNALFSILVFIWVFIFYLITTKTHPQIFSPTTPELRRQNDKLMRKLKYLAILLGIFPFLTGIPLLNRFLQIITLDLLGIHIIWRSLIIATALYFGPIYIKKFYGYQKRTKIYKDELEKAAAIELVKVRLKG